MSMTNRERFRAAMAFEPTDRPCHVEHGFWQETYLRWQQEGLPENVLEPPFGYLGTGPDLYDHFGISRFGYLLCGQYFILPFESEILEETDTYIIMRDGVGATVKSSKGAASLPQVLRTAVACRADYEAVKERLQPQLTARYPENWDELARQLREQQDVLVCTHMEGFYAYPRTLLGVEGLSYVFYDDPDLIRDMLNDRVEFYMTVYEHAIRDTRPDFAFIWEDMCFKNGPLISPAIFEEFLLPCYQRLTDWLRGLGIRTVVVDSDGDVSRLIPLWLRGGVNCLLPFEVKAGMDVVRIGEQYPELRLIGGIDKHALERTPTEIDAELDRVLPAMLARGGYAVSLDHWVQPEIPLVNFDYYTKRIRDFNTRM